MRAPWLPSSVLLVILGLVAGALLPAGMITVTPELVLLVLVPGLVFEAALRVDLHDLRPTLGWMILLAAPGVLLSAAIVAVVLNLAAGLPLQLGMVVGAMVAATDPVAVITTFRSIGAPPRLQTLIEGESLLNDGTALVLFGVAVTATTSTVAIGDAAVGAGIHIVESVGIGLVGGWLGSRVIKAIHNHVIEVAVSAVVAYGTYLLADELGQSGIIATVVAGVVIGTYGRAVGLSPRALATLDVVWEVAAVVLTAVAFFLVGLAISFTDLVGVAPSIVWAVVGILVGRGIVVYGLLGGAARLIRARRHLTAVPIGWLHVMFWAGLRGAVAVAMALSLPPSFPQRELLQEITFGVVLFTLFAQGTTARRVVARFGGSVRSGSVSPA